MNYTMTYNGIKYNIILRGVNNGLNVLNCSNGSSRVVCTVEYQYITKTDKGLKRVKIKASDNKRIGDQIKIENL